MTASSSRPVPCASYVRWAERRPPAWEYCPGRIWRRTFLWGDDAEVRLKDYTKELLREHPKDVVVLIYLAHFLLHALGRIGTADV